MKTVKKLGKSKKNLVIEKGQKNRVKKRQNNHIAMLNNQYSREKSPQENHSKHALKIQKDARKKRTIAQLLRKTEFEL